MNVAGDIFKCGKCEEVSSNNAQVPDKPLYDGDGYRTPEDAWFKNKDDCIVIGGFTNKKGQWFYLIGGSIASIIILKNILPETLGRAEFELDMLLIAGLLFLYLLLRTIWRMCFLLFGHVEISICRKTGAIFNGIGSIGFKRVFEWNTMDDIEFLYDEPKNSEGPVERLVLRGIKNIEFASDVNPEIRNFFYYTIKKAKNL